MLVGKPITKETASAMGKRSAEVMKQRRVHAEMLALATANTAKQTVNPYNLDQDSYVSCRLATIRAQLSRLDLRMLQVSDADEANKLASAIARLTDVEFALANRPQPAVAKSSPARTIQRRNFIVPGESGQ